MTEEQIKALAKSLGLNPDNLILREPYIKDIGYGPLKFYRMLYYDENKRKRYDYCFLVDREDIPIEDQIVEFRVNIYLRRLASNA